MNSELALNMYLNNANLILNPLIIHVNFNNIIRIGKNREETLAPIEIRIRDLLWHGLTLILHN